ncbi:bis(5'-adenosyl)-triphosphatase [Martiniozyma asiatica (nom. inval.)]|nr:bis(5'-adenosyl)-triphosphatase [Martiniozyma asiatica]
MVQLKFHKFAIGSQVFYQSPESFSIVNLRPLVPGHVLVVPVHNVPRLSQLTPAESADFFATVVKVQRFIEYHYQADSCNIAVQDGWAAGQSVPHVHCHILPRYGKDGFGDDIYQMLELWEGGLIDAMDGRKIVGGIRAQTGIETSKDAAGQAEFVPTQPWYKQIGAPFAVLKEEERVDRTVAVMEQEALQLKESMARWMAGQEPQ